MKGPTRASIVAAILTAAAACNGQIGGPAGPPPGGGSGALPPLECDPTAEAPRPEPLHWKRVHALESDLAAALALDPTEVCAEVDRFRCSDIHVVPLGGNDPFANAQYVPVARPMATTPMAVDRMVLISCQNRVDRDGTGAPEVFTDLVPSDTPADLGDAATRDAFDAQLATLYRRLLTRDPTEDELSTLHDLAVDDAGAPVTRRELDVLSCYAIGTTTEFLFF